MIHTGAEVQLSIKADAKLFSWGELAFSYAEFLFSTFFFFFKENAEEKD